MFRNQVNTARGLKLLQIYTITCSMHANISLPYLVSFIEQQFHQVWSILSNEHAWVIPVCCLKCCRTVALLTWPVIPVIKAHFLWVMSAIAHVELTEYSWHATCRRSGLRLAFSIWTMKTNCSQILPAGVPGRLGKLSFESRTRARKKLRLEGKEGGGGDKESLSFLGHSTTS